MVAGAAGVVGAAEFKVQGSGCKVQGSGFRFQGSGFKVQGSGFRFQGSGCRVQGAGCRVQGSGCKVCTAQHHAPRQHGPERYRGTSFIRNRHPVGPYSRTMPRVLGGS